MKKFIFFSDKALMYLEDMATRQIFFPWEVSDLSDRQRYELASLTENTRIIELLHKAAYRKGLGYPLFAPKRNVDKISSESVRTLNYTSMIFIFCFTSFLIFFILYSEQLQHFVNNHFTGQRCAVVGAGVSLSYLSSFANALNVPSGNPPTTPSKYCGGEIRKERESPLASVALAVESSGFDKDNEALAFAILQQAVGSGIHVKWGTTSAPLQKSVASAAGNDPFGIVAFNASYSDSGLFGIILQAPFHIAGAVSLNNLS